MSEKTKTNSRGCRLCCGLPASTGTRKAKSIESSGPNKRIEDVFNPYPLTNRYSLSESYPEIAAFWCYEKNCGFGPEDFSAGSQVKAWWRCVNNENHIFQQTIKTRVYSERTETHFHGCTYCKGLLVDSSNSLAKYPEIAKEWLTEKNGISPEQVVAKGNTVGWWRCSRCSNEWQTASLNRVVKGSGCHYCAGQLVNETNSLATLHPEIAKQWHITLNGTFTPEHVTPSSPKMIWWQCPNDANHFWQASAYTRAIKKNGCQKCALAPYKMTPENVEKAVSLLETKTFSEVALIIGVNKSTLHRMMKKLRAQSSVL